MNIKSSALINFLNSFTTGSKSLLSFKNNDFIKIDPIIEVLFVNNVKNLLKPSSGVVKHSGELKKKFKNLAHMLLFYNNLPPYSRLFRVYKVEKYKLTSMNNLINLTWVTKTFIHKKFCFEYNYFNSIPPSSKQSENELYIISNTNLLYDAVENFDVDNICASQIFIYDDKQKLDMYSPYVAKLVQFKHGLATMHINSDFNWCLNLKSMLDYEYGKNKWNVNQLVKHDRYRVVPYQFTFLNEQKRFKELDEIDEYISNVVDSNMKYFLVNYVEGLVSDNEQLEMLFQCNQKSKIFKELVDGKKYTHVYNIVNNIIEKSNYNGELDMFITTERAQKDNVFESAAGSIAQQQIPFSFESSLNKLDSRNVFEYLNDSQKSIDALEDQEVDTMLAVESDDLGNVLDLSTLIGEINCEINTMQDKQEIVYKEFYHATILKLTENVALQHFISHPYYYIPSRHYTVCKFLRELFIMYLPDSCFIINIEILNDYLSLLSLKSGFELFRDYYNYMVRLSVAKDMKFANVLEASQTKHGRFYAHITALYILFHASKESFDDFPMII